MGFFPSTSVFNQDFFHGSFSQEDLNLFHRTELGIIFFFLTYNDSPSESPQGIGCPVLKV
jgi:hypothetical protein